MGLLMLASVDRLVLFVVVSRQSYPPPSLTSHLRDPPLPLFAGLRCLYLRMSGMLSENWTKNSLRSW